MKDLAEELRRIAQNDYMIDGEFLPDGVLLQQAAKRITELQEDLKEAYTEINILEWNE